MLKRLPSFFKAFFKSVRTLGVKDAWRLAKAVNRKKGCVVTGCKGVSKHYFFILGDHYPVCNLHTNRNVPPTFTAHYRGRTTCRKVRTFFRYLGAWNYRPGIDPHPGRSIKNRIGIGTAWDVATIVHDPIEKLEHHKKPQKTRIYSPDMQVVN